MGETGALTRAAPTLIRKASSFTKTGIGAFVRELKRGCAGKRKGKGGKDTWVAMRPTVRVTILFCFQPPRRWRIIGAR